MLILHTCLLCFLLAVVPRVLAVIMAKGRENAYDNGYIETTNSQFQQECIEWHNYFRKIHGAAPLTYSSTLANYARRRAIQLAKKDGTNFYHPDDLPYGENLAWNSQEPIDCRIPLQLWYDEWKIYNFQRPNINPSNGHFTQMVWKDTTRIGCAQTMSKGANGGTYTVCNYDPPGNYENEELDNVTPAMSGAFVDFNPRQQMRKKVKKIYYKVTKQNNNDYNGYNGYNKYNGYGGGYQQYNTARQSQPTTNSYGSQTYTKWYNFRPHTSGHYQGSGDSNYYNKGTNKYNTYQNGQNQLYKNYQQRYKPSFRMTLGHSKPTYYW